MADRLFWPALVVDADGVPHPVPACEGAGCNQGRKPCDCMLASDDPEPSQTFRRRANWLAAGQALIGLVGFAAILALLQPNT